MQFCESELSKRSHYDGIFFILMLHLSIYPVLSAGNNWELPNLMQDASFTRSSRSVISGNSYNHLKLPNYLHKFCVTWGLQLYCRQIEKSVFLGYFYGDRVFQNNEELSLTLYYSLGVHEIGWPGKQRCKGVCYVNTSEACFRFLIHDVTFWRSSKMRLGSSKAAKGDESGNMGAASTEQWETRDRKRCIKGGRSDGSRSQEPAHSLGNHHVRRWESW